MYLLQFHHKGNEYFLHDGESFIGGNTEEEARKTSINNTAKSISIGGFDIVNKSPEELSKMIGGVPYSIINFTGGFGIPFCGVKIIEGLEE